MVFFVNVDDILHPHWKEKHIVRFSLQNFISASEKYVAVVKSGIFALWPNIIIPIAPIETENCQHKRDNVFNALKSMFSTCFHDFHKMFPINPIKRI